MIAMPTTVIASRKFVVQHQFSYKKIPNIIKISELKM